MLAEMAVADAYGISFEFVPNTPDRPNDLARYYQHPTYDDMVPGHYTDDTQRSIANALMVIDNASGDKPLCADIFHPISYLEYYQFVFDRDPRPGYSKRFEAFLKENRTAEVVDMALALNRKPTNGSVMGVATLGFLPTIEAVKLAAAAQTISTHSHAAIPYAQMVALSAFYTINDVGKLDDLAPWLKEHLGETSHDMPKFLVDNQVWGQSPPPRPTTMAASSPVRLMLWALPRHNSLSELVKLAVDIGGDTDSAAAVMVAVASESRAYMNDLPEHLVQGLENGQYGRDYLRDLDQQLRNIR